MFSNIHNLISILLLVRILEVCTYLGVEEIEEDINDPIEMNNADWDVLCKLQPNSYNCFKNNHSDQYRFYYDLQMETCKTFQYGGCALTYNSFTKLSDCSKTCFNVGNRILSPAKTSRLVPDVICRLQPEFGSGSGYQPLYYYDTTARMCRGFSYSGIGGNPNRFENKFECSDSCETIVPEYKLTETTLPWYKLVSTTVPAVPEYKLAET